MGSHIGHTRWRKTVASAVVATHLAACHSWRVEAVPPTQLLATSHPSEIRVTRQDSSKVVLATPGIVRDSLWGWSRGAELGMPLTDVRAIATRHGDAGKSVFLGVGIFAGLAATVGVICATTDCFTFQWRFGSAK